jgi:peroxiredoxin Q/BCP
MIIEKGSQAPDFALKDQDGRTVSLDSFKGKNNVVLVFYPGDETPGCTKQLCAIRDDYSKFAEKDALVFGVNPAGMESHRKFIDNHRFPFPLLVDENSATAKAYGCDGLLMVKRTVVVIGKDGVILYLERGSPPVSEILDAIPVKP